jgi:hypothetical protein
LDRQEKVMAPGKGAGELEIILRTYQLVLWTCRHVARFPRCHRIPLGDRLEQRLPDVQDLLP